MSALSAAARRVGTALALNARNRMAMIYGFVFPLIFLAAFWTIYRHDQAPLIRHLGELLTVTVLGGACFGLPTTMVSERERGVWRAYRLTPAPAWTHVAATLAARFVLLALAVAVQLALALALGMPAPAHPLGLAAAFVMVCAAFMGLGLVVAMIADNVPAVQALGQCIFLPMLMLGGVAVPLATLPEWAQRLSAFFPGRYAVQALQAGATGEGLAGAAFEMAALAAIAVVSGAAALALFRWSPGRAPRTRGRTLRLAGAAGVWIVAGALASMRGQALSPHEARAPQPASEAWRSVGAADFANIAFERLPSDASLVTPIAPPGETPDPLTADQLDVVRAALPAWPPAQVADPVQRTRNLLFVAAVPDELQMSELERFLPHLVLERLQEEIGPADLPKALYWVAMHPMEGDDSAAFQLEPLGLPRAEGSTEVARERVMIYALKLLGRLTGDIDPDAPAGPPAPESPGR